MNLKPSGFPWAETAPRLNLWNFALAAALAWTALIAASLVWGRLEQRRGMLDHARHDAQVSSEKEMLFRFWAHGRGGSAPATSNMSPSPDLARALASEPLLRQVLERNPETAGNRNHLASLKPTEPENAADAWETQALRAFAQGETEFASVTTLDSQEYMRVMRPLVNEASCLSCHGAQDYNIGEIRGGISVAVPLAPLKTYGQGQFVALLIVNGAIWVLGLGVIGFGTRRLQAHESERVRAETVLHHSEVRYRTLADSGQALIWTSGPDKKCDYFNQPWLAFTGRTFAQEQGDGWVEGVHPDDRARCLETYANAFARREAFSLVQRLRRHDGEFRWIQHNGSPRHDSTGNFVGYITHGLDITERKQAEEALRMEHLLFSSLLSTIPDNIYFKDRESRFVRINDRMAGFFGLRNAADAIGKTDADFFSEEHARPAYEDEQRIMGTGVPIIGLEEKETWPNGRITWASSTKVPLHDADGRISGLVGISRDITERKKVEEALRENEERFRVLADSAQDAIVMFDDGDQILFWNGAAARLFGYTKAEAIGAKFHPLVVPERFRDAFTKGFAQLQQTGTRAEIGEVAELAALRKSGAEFPVELSLSMVTLHERQAAIGIFRDITERRRTQEAMRMAMEEAKASVRLKSQFLANMSHEIRTPLNGIVGMTGLLLDTELTSEQRTFANTVRTSADCLLTIINDILDFSKIEAGMLTFEQRPFALRVPVETCLQLMAERAHTKGLELAYLIDDNVPVQVVGDAGRLQQVLLNLVGNALKFTERGEVVVRVRRESEEGENVWLRFTVTDTGIGIGREARSRLFQPFSQADGSVTRKFGGTGLGLAISKQLVGLMGGAIGVESEVGRGSTFWFTVKLAAQPAALRVIPRRVDLAGQRALIVDDNQTNREILQRQLNAWRVSTACAADGESALALLRSTAQAGPPFTLALLDMQMPGMSGLDLARQISADPALAGLKMLVLTSMGSMPPFGEITSAGVAACLTKPVQQAELQEAIASLFGMSKPRPVAPVAPSRLPPEPKPLRILLAEDNVVNQNVARMQLARLGYMVDIVVDGRAALEAAQAHPYDVVLMDCQMPEMDGYEATRQLRVWEQTRRAAGGNRADLYIIAMTASAMAGDREACLAAGMDDYISKPVQSSELAAALARSTTHQA